MVGLVWLGNVWARLGWVWAGMVWVWIGCLFMAIGGFVAIFGKKQSLALPSKNKRIAVNTNLASKQNETTVKPT